MAKKIAKAEGEEVKNTIPELDALKKEYMRAAMPERKLLALRTKLVSLHLEEKVTEEELAFMELILKRDAANGKIADTHYEVLNRLEMSRCEDECIVKTNDAPAVHYLHKDQVCKFTIETDDKGISRFAVYVERKIPPEFQMTRDLIKKEERGHFADESEYPKERTLIHKLSLKKKEFDAWFDIVEDELARPIKQEIEYTF